MGFNFPNSPTEGAVYSAASGQQYTFTNGVWLQTGFAYAPLLTAQPYNRVVNGAMQHSQEWGNTLLGATGYYVADQWTHGYVTTGQPQFQRVQVRTPNGSTDRLRIIVQTADTSLAAGEYWQIYQSIEGSRVADFQWGTAQAKQAIVRFGFKGPAGTYSLRVGNGPTPNRSYLANFTISAAQANTDTTQTFIVPGDTTGTWGTDNQFGMAVVIGLAAGSTFTGVAGWQSGVFFQAAGASNGLASTSNIFELFDVGLYLDPDATGKAPSWQTPDYASELAACMRYWQKTGASWVVETGTLAQASFLPTSMRTAPATTGGGAGFFGGADTRSIFCYQTARAFQNLIFNARM